MTESQIALSMLRGILAGLRGVLGQAGDGVDYSERTGQARLSRAGRNAWTLRKR